MNKIVVIAEAGVNHNGDPKLARRLIDAAKESGADIVKFQTFRADNLAVPAAKKAAYQTQTTDASESQLDMLRNLELSQREQASLVKYCESKKIEFLSTPFDLESAGFLTKKLHLPLIKIGSGDITNAPLLLQVARALPNIILSTGMSSLREVEEALAVLAFGYRFAQRKPSPLEFEKAYASPSGQDCLKEKVILLHCTSEYPAPFCDINLNAMLTLKSAFQLPVGLSDHSEGIAIPIAAAAMGARVIEKHLTLDRNLSGPDHRASLEPSEFAEMAQAIRNVSSALGDGIKRPSPSELSNRSVVRRSLVTSRNTGHGQKLNLVAKRPAGGVSPMQYWDYEGTKATRDYDANERIEP